MLQKKIAAIQGAAEVYYVTGRYDLGVVIRVRENDQLAAVVAEQIRGIEAIERTETLIACRVYCRYDLEMAFSLRYGEKIGTLRVGSLVVIWGNCCTTVM